VPGRIPGRIASIVLAAILAGRLLRETLHQFRRGVGIRAVLRARFLELGLTATVLLLLASTVFVGSQMLAGGAIREVLDPVYRQYAAGFLVAAGLRLLIGGFPVRRILHRLEFRPAQTVALGFAAAILGGTLLLSLPPAVVALERVSMLDALFTAASAVTVTGLTVADTDTFYTGFGQLVILALIQLGGLGTMAASASLVVLAGRRLRLRAAAALLESMDLQTLGQVVGQLRTILAVTLAVEGIGALLLMAAWADHPAVDRPVFAAIFHAVSAFCNAGFSIIPGNLARFRDHVATNLIVAGLIGLGGIGFPVLHGLAVGLRAWRVEGRPMRQSLHTRLALWTSGILLTAGMAMFLLLEWNGTLAALSWPRALQAAFFQSVTARTAGFNTVDIGLLRPATLWVLLILMFIGGCPGSTAGGIKTTTAATVAATLWGTLRGRERVEAFGRTIPGEQIAKALAVMGVSAAVVAVTTLGLLTGEAGDSLKLTFEAVSAFGTVGLSTGLTPGLSTAGKLLIILAMFIGRTGPLTLAFALAARRAPSRVRFPEEKIMIG
jgi:trk system potassium uptake protein TrkH